MEIDVELLFSSFMSVALIMLQVDVFQQEQVRLPTARSSTAQSNIIHSMTQACTLSRTPSLPPLPTARTMYFPENHNKSNIASTDIDTENTLPVPT